MSKDRENPTITNFRKINEWFYRGGQPREDEYGQLVDLGVKTVICLRWNKKIIRREQEIVNEHDLEFVSIPLNYWRPPSQNEIEKFFSVLEDSSRRPVYLHCKHGSDRTGMLTAFYRIRLDGWSFEKAYEEMKNSGFHKIKMHHFKYVVSGFARREKLL